uniref:Tyrosine-protein kinase ephrin type A/B receptor-like domain-containing protein n=1 Tax=Tetradesmus obliquus TaxID=3088 RepID=A0A383VEL2_TETOB|eukprot:jgi/Sobl393_1/17722/SZX63104.1
MIEMPDETVTASGNNNVEPSNGDGESSHFPGIITVPSLQDVSSGGAPVVLRNSSAGGSICPDGNPPVNCVFDPCAATTCLAGTTCVSNYCGGCNARCVAVPANSTVNSTAGSSGPGVITGPNVAPAEEDCPADKPPVDCNFNPCDGIRCLDGLVCKPTFCGTCGYTCQPHGAPVDPSAACPYNACSRVRCEPSAYKTVCQRDSRSCNYRCVALQPPPCEAGSGFSATSRRCKPCKAGYVSSAGSNVCAACAVDYYSSRDHTTCLPCPPGYSTNGLFGVSRCSKVKTIDG